VPPLRPVSHGGSSSGPELGPGPRKTRVRSEFGRLGRVLRDLFGVCERGGGGPGGAALKPARGLAQVSFRKVGGKGCVGGTPGKISAALM